MSETIDIEEKQPTKFRMWSFRIFIYHVILTVVMFSLVANLAAFSEEQIIQFAEKLFYFEALSMILLFAGVITTLVSFYRREKADYRLIIGSIGNGIFLVLPLLQL